MQDRLRIVLLVLGISSIALYMAAIAVYGPRSLITIVLVTLSAALWLWISIFHIKKRAAMGSIPLLSDFNIAMVAAIVITLATFITGVVIVLRCYLGV